MPLGLRRGTVSVVLEQEPELVRLEVDGIPCVAYPRLTGEVEVGDDVLVNEQARLLELGSGGFDVLYANLTRGLGLRADEGAHVMALPYTPGQVARTQKEETDALAWAAADGYDAVVCSVGPGIVGTGTRLGHGAVALADAANVTSALGGRPVLAVRTSDADPRERHRGVS